MRIETTRERYIYVDDDDELMMKKKLSLCGGLSLERYRCSGFV